MRRRAKSEVDDRPEPGVGVGPGLHFTEDKQMALYRWEDYLCTNLGNCKRADRRDIIDLPHGATPICPTCGRPVIPLRAREIVLVSPPSTVRSRPAKRRGRRLAASFVLFLLGVCGGTVAVLMHSPRARTAQVRPLERLYLAVPGQVTARAGDALQVPIMVGPETPANLVLKVDGPLPPGVSLDTKGRQLYGTVQNAGVSPIILTARAPNYTGASAQMTIVVKPDLTSAAVLALQVPPEVEGRVGAPLEIPLAIIPAMTPDATLTVVGKLPAGVSLDSAGKRLLGTPRAPGSYGVIVKASAPDSAPALAEVTFTIADAQPSPAPTPMDAKPSPSPPPMGTDNAVAKADADRPRADVSGTPPAARSHRGRLTTRNGK